MTDTSEQSIVVEGLEKWYGDVQALRGIDFCVDSGEVVGFLGPNGAGKTTTMKILTSSMAASSGEVTVAGHDVRTQSEEVRQKIGYLPENVPLYDDMIVADYLHFVAQMQGVGRALREERVRDVATRTGVESVLGKTIRELSKGFRQRVGLAQAIVHRPEVIVLDEPTTGLDPNQIIDIRDVITSIGRHKTVLLSTHILQEVSAVCDRIIIIDDGRIVADDSIEALRDAVDVPEATLEDIFRWFTLGNCTGADGGEDSDDDGDEADNGDEADSNDGDSRQEAAASRSKSADSADATA